MRTFLKPLKPVSFFLFLSLITGILLGNFSPDFKDYASLVISCLIFLLCLSFCSNKKSTFIFILLLFCCFGYFSLQRTIYPDFTDDHISNYLDLKGTTITAKIVSFTNHYEKKYKIIVSCKAIEANDQTKRKVSGKIHLTIYGLSESLPEFGDIIVFESTVHSVQNFMNPGAFDYKKFLQTRGIYGTAYCNAKKIKVVKNHLSVFVKLIRKIEALRTNYYFFVLKQTNHSENGKILASLITGKKELISSDTRELFSKSGISHLFAISGLHLSIVGFLFFYLFYRFLFNVPILSITGQAKKISGIITIFPLIGYSIFSGASPSTLRAFIMTVVFLLAFVSEKEKDILSSLSIAGILILITDVTALFAISFQLSFAAVVFIIYGLSLLKKIPFLFKKNIFGKMGVLLCVTFLAGLGTLPLTAHYFHIVSAIALFSNFIFIPMIGFVVLPLGLISLVCFSYFPFLADFIVNFCRHLISFSITASEFLVSIPGSWYRVMSLQWIGITAFYLFIICVYLTLKGHRKTPAVMFVLGVVLIALTVSTNRLENGFGTQLTITVIDVGQGNSALIQTPEGKNILVDGGGFSDISSFDTGKYILAPFLWQNKIHSLDFIILTHPEADHLNGLIYILKNFKVGTLIKNVHKKNSASYENLIKTCLYRGIKIWNPSYKDDFLNCGSTRLVFMDSAKEQYSDNLNNTSLVFKILYNDFSMLFPGDILKDREESLSMNGRFDLCSKVLLSPHHGSSTSSTKVFLDKVQAKSVIISCGRNNRYQFPHYSVLERYRNMGSQIFRTDINGAIVVSSDGQNYIIRTHKGG